MFIQILVKENIDGGLAVVKALRADRVPVSMAFWCRIPESGYWRLVIASKSIDRIGPLEGYKKLHVILDRLGLWDRLSGSISLLSPGDPTFRNLLEHAQSPGQFGVDPAIASHSSVFQAAYFYEPRATVPG